VLLKPTTQVAHEGGSRFKTDSPEYQILRRWIGDRMPRDSASTPELVRLDVMPGERVLFEPADQVQIKAIATFSDDSQRDDSNLSVYEQSTDLAKITPAGQVRRERNGEMTVIVRYLNLQQPVRLAFVPARPDFVWRP